MAKLKTLMIELVDGSVIKIKTEDIFNVEVKNIEIYPIADKHNYLMIEFYRLDMISNRSYHTNDIYKKEICYGLLNQHNIDLIKNNINFIEKEVTSDKR